MKQFVDLYLALDGSTSTNSKLAALVGYFERAQADDAAWAVYFLAGGTPKRTVPTRTLREVALAVTGLPLWLFDECYQTVGDLAETIAHILPLSKPAQVQQGEHRDLAWWMENRILPLRDLDEQTRVEVVRNCWSELTAMERFLFVKLVGGGFRVGVSKLLVTRALAAFAKLDPKWMATRLMGYADAKTPPTAMRYMALFEQETPSQPHTSARLGQPLPFFLAHPFQADIETLGDVSQWQVEWKFDGIRAQVVKDAGQVWVWSRGEELVCEQFPELLDAFASWPDGTVLDGEILVWRSGEIPAAFNELQVRLNRKVVSKKLQQDNPVVFIAYDLLRTAGESTVDRTQRDRRDLLEKFVNALAGHSMALEMALEMAPEMALGAPRLRISERVQANSWAELATLRQESRRRGVEGFMLKHVESRYGVGRTKADGTWWKWKIDPMTIDCVLVYAQRGHGRRANLYTDYTFAVWSEPPDSKEQALLVAQAIQHGEKVEDTMARGLPRLVPFAKAYSGLTDEEFREVDHMIKKNTVDKFGPVRTVVPCLVFELGFEAIAKSNRHKSGVAVRFPRMLRIRYDKPLHEADCLARLEAMLPVRY